MAKQLLIYESAVPVSAARHAGVCVEPNESYAFIAGVNAVPLMAVEFLRASAEYAIFGPFYTGIVTSIDELVART